VRVAYGRHVVRRSLPAPRSIKHRPTKVPDRDDDDAEQEAEEGEPEPEMVPCPLPPRASSHDPARAKVSAVRHPPPSNSAITLASPGLLLLSFPCCRGGSGVPHPRAKVRFPGLMRR
jgi:hypothetical protein